jgi:cysteine-rich repeat protein
LKTVRNRPPCWLPLIAVTVLLAAPPIAWAHRDPLPLSTWGDFGSSPARCQRALGRAAVQCTLDVWAARRACIEPQLAGERCDTNATGLAATQARERAVRAVEHACSDTDATTIQFLGTFEAVSDLRSICRQLEKALTSAAYGPGMVDDVVMPVDATTRACLIAAADVAGATVRFAMRELREPLDMIAAQLVDPTRKTEQVAAAGTRAARAGARLGSALAARCVPGQFEPLYHRSIERFIADLTSRGACLAGGVYVQNAAVCPPAICGNGMVEPTEECDDANQDDGDACGNDCLRNDPME